MRLLEMFLLSITICIDSFILCLTTRCTRKINYFIIPLIFSMFQIFFLFIGYNTGNLIENYLSNYLKYLIFLIFSFMGLKLIIDSFINKDKEETCPSLKLIILQALLTSFDSLFLGIPISFSNTNYLYFLIVIGLITFLMCFISLLIRKKINLNYEDKINLIGSIILFIFAFKSLL